MGETREVQLAVLAYASDADQLSAILRGADIPPNYLASTVEERQPFDALTAKCADLGCRLFRYGTKFGYGNAMNQIASIAVSEGATHLLFLQPGIQMSKNQLSMLLRSSHVLPNHILSPTVRNDAGGVWFEGGHFELRSGYVSRGSWVEQPYWLDSSCLLVPVPVWLQLGGFAGCFSRTWEAVDLTFRWKLRGGGLGVLRTSVVRQEWSAHRIEVNRDVLRSDRRSARDRMVFAGRNLGFHDLLRWWVAGSLSRPISSEESASSDLLFFGHLRSVVLGSLEGVALGVIARIRRYSGIRVANGRAQASADTAAPLLERIEYEVQTVNPRPKLFAYPYYPDNDWQRITYSKLEDVGIEVEPRDSLLPHATRLLPGDILHVNWTAPISQAEASAELASERVRDSIEQIKMAKSLGVRVLWTVHNILPHECRFPGVEVELLNELGTLADLIMVMNPATVELASELYSIPPEKVWIMPHSSYLGAVAEPTSRLQARLKLGIDEGAKVLLCFGELRPYKQVDRVIRAFRGLDGDDFRLIVAGRPSGGITEDMIWKMRGDDARIILKLCRQNEAETATLFSAADILVQTYRSGLNSGAAALAATFGRPVAVGVGRETEHLRLETWVTETDLSDDQYSTQELMRVIDWAVEEADPLRAAAMLWAERMHPSRIAGQFAERLSALSAGLDPADGG